MNITFKPFRKQWETLKYLEDDVTTEIVYGGGAAGGKSELGCSWIIMNCYKYPGCRYMIGRKVLKALKGSTLKTFFDVCKKWGLKKDKDYYYNVTSGTITFLNTSEVVLKDLAENPADPDYDSLGSFEVTGIFVDEAAEVSEKCKDVLKSRIRYKLNEFNLKPKLLITTNPSKNWLYTTFYKPFIENTLPPYRKFVPALAKDNPYVPQSYIDNLYTLDEVSKQRLLFGNWDYADDTTTLMDYNVIISLFDNTNNIDTTGSTHYITADIAYMGKDSTVIMVWKDYQVIEIIEYNKQSIGTSGNKIKQLMQIHNVNERNVIYDVVGVGSGIYDYVPQAVQFGSSGSNSPLGRDRNYSTLKTQIAYYFAKACNDGKVGICKTSTETKKRIMEELAQLKRDKVDQDGKMFIVSKDQIKKVINRSPDYLDCLIYRFYFDVAKRGTGKYGIQVM